MPGVSEQKNDEFSASHLRGRLRFTPQVTHAHLVDQCAAGATLTVTTLSVPSDYAAFQARYGNAAILLFVITETKNLRVLSTDVPLTPTPGQHLISLAPAEADQTPAAL